MFAAFLHSAALALIVPVLLPSICSQLLQLCSQRANGLRHEQLVAHSPEEEQCSAALPFPLLLTSSIQLDTSEALLESLELRIFDNLFLEGRESSNHKPFCLLLRRTDQRRYLPTYLDGVVQGFVSVHQGNQTSKIRIDFARTRRLGRAYGSV